MIWIIIFLIYILAGASLFAGIEEWYYLDGVYWADSTLLTVGFGDITPKKTLGRILLFPYAGVGLVILAIVVYLVTQVVKDAEISSVEISVAEWLLNTRLWKWSRLWKRGGGPRNDNEFEERRSVRRLAALIGFLVWALVWVTLLSIGAAVFNAAERDQEMDYGIWLYFAYVSLFTIGYGDFYPKSPFGRVFFVFWSLLSVPVVTVLISTLAGVSGRAFSNSHLLRRLWKKIYGPPDTSEGQALNSINERGDKRLLAAHTISLLLCHRLNQTHPATFTYEEWEYFISLIRALRSDIRPLTSDGDNDRVLPKSLQVNSLNETLGSSETIQEWEKSDFAWTSEDNPIMTSTPEIDWLLEGLAMELVRNLSTGVAVQSVTIASGSQSHGALDPNAL
jgi:hypothetical protein